MNKKYVIALILCFCFLIKHEPAVAVRHSADEIRNIISEVEKKIGVLVTCGADGYAADEIKKIELYAGNSKKSLSESETDKAYYEIMKAKSYFKLVEAEKCSSNRKTGRNAFRPRNR
jgi:hypothetical protein